MSAEKKKFLWLSLSICAVVLVLAATGLFLFAPKADGATAPATIGNVAAPKSLDPQEYLVSPPPTPSFEQPRDSTGDVIVVYGEKPTSFETTAPLAGVPTTSSVPMPAATATPPAPKASIKPTSAAPSATAVKVQTPKKTVADEYWIQAASFSSRGRADELKETLSSKGIASLISVKDIDGKSWYRVRIGPYGAKSEAEGWLERLKVLPGCSEAYISKTIVERNG